MSRALQKIKTLADESLGNHGRSYLVFPLIIIFSSVFVYLNSLGGDFVWDDIAQIVENSYIRSLSNIPSFFAADLGRYSASPELASPYYRPVFLLSYAIDYSLWGLNPVGYHISNVLLHALCSLLVYAVCIRLLKERLAAFISGMIFAVHPVHAENVAWLAGRADLLAASLFFVSFYLYILFRGKKKILLLGISLVAYFFSLFSKEMAISLPLLIIIYEFSKIGGETDKHAPVKFSYVLFYLTATGIYLFSRMRAMGSLVLSNDVSPPFDRGRIYAIPGIILDYVRSFFFPVNLKIAYDIPLKRAFLDPAVFLPVLILAVILFLVFLSYKKNRNIFFGSMWFLATIAPVLGPAGMLLMADRYLYLPSLGLCLLAGVFLSRIIRNVSWSIYGQGIVLLVLIAFSLITFQRNRIWNDEFSYDIEAVADAPKIALFHNNLGKWYLKNKMYTKAISVLDKSVQLDPNLADPFLTLGCVYYEMGLYQKAISEYQKVVDMSQKDSRDGSVNPIALADAYNGIGSIYRVMGKIDEAIASWKMAVSINPGHADANNNLGNVYLLKGDFADAAESYKIVLQGRPLHAEAHYNLAVALEKMGKKTEAMDHYRIFLDLGQKDYKELAQEVRRKFGWQ